MQLLENVDLRDHVTFHVPCNAKYLCLVNSDVDVHDALRWAQQHNAELRVLGGGSNVLPGRDVSALVIAMRIRGREVRIEQDDVFITLGAGETWHDVVQWTVENGWYGLENLALIPGTVGAAPMQNIGAYGVEQNTTFVNLEAINVHTGESRTFENNECAFGYRTSVFKTTQRSAWVIVRVTYRLQKFGVLHFSYKDVQEELTAMHVTTPTQKDIFTAVVNVRTRKLPNPDNVGNAGSFFKNPVVDVAVAERLLAQNPTIPTYPVDSSTVKLAAGWLIDQCGWKGYRSGDIGVHPNQALVLVNYGTGTGAEILDLSEKIVSSVRNKYGVELEREVNVW